MIGVAALEWPGLDHPVIVTTSGTGPRGCGIRVTRAGTGSLPLFGPSFSTSTLNSKKLAFASLRGLLVSNERSNFSVKKGEIGQSGRAGPITGNLGRPQRYNRRLRQVFYMAAFSGIEADGPSDLLPVQTRRTADPHPSPARPRPTFGSTSNGTARDGRLFTMTAPPPVDGADFLTNHSDSSGRAAA